MIAAAVIAGLGVATPAGAVTAARGAVPAAGSRGRAIEIPGLQALNTGGSAQVSSVSCDPAGNCTAGGSYTESPSLNPFQTLGFVVSRFS